VSEVRAAGGAVWRRGPDGRPEVLLVHRPRYDDWSFPKGKLDDGESWETAAVREVEEETGLRCRLGTELAETTYTDAHGRPKRVRYWLMAATADVGFAPNDEVDERRWVPLDEAVRLLSYGRDRLLIDALLAAIG
jgi:8-oxo-dGTP pyrophosphatase MutT (NUDIX family)